MKVANAIMELWWPADTGQKWSKLSTTTIFHHPKALSSVGRRYLWFLQCPVNWLAWTTKTLLLEKQNKTFEIRREN